MCATEDNLSKVFDLKTSILHLSAHGALSEEGDFLVFETKEGAPYYLSQMKLKDLLDNRIL
jgi:hypothetical protein